MIVEKKGQFLYFFHLHLAMNGLMVMVRFMAHSILLNRKLMVHISSVAMIIISLSGVMKLLRNKELISLIFIILQPIG